MTQAMGGYGQRLHSLHRLAQKQERWLLDACLLLDIPSRSQLSRASKAMFAFMVGKHDVKLDLLWLPYAPARAKALAFGLGAHNGIHLRLCFLNDSELTKLALLAAFSKALSIVQPPPPTDSSLVCPQLQLHTITQVTLDGRWVQSLECMVPDFLREYCVNLRTLNIQRMAILPEGNQPPALRIKQPQYTHAASHLDTLNLEVHLSHSLTSMDIKQQLARVPNLAHLNINICRQQLRQCWQQWCDVVMALRVTLVSLTINPVDDCLLERAHWSKMFHTGPSGSRLPFFRLESFQTQLRVSTVEDWRAILDSGKALKRLHVPQINMFTLANVPMPQLQQLCVDRLDLHGTGRGNHADNGLLRAVGANTQQYGGVHVQKVLHVQSCFSQPERFHQAMTISGAHVDTRTVILELEDEQLTPSTARSTTAQRQAVAGQINAGAARPAESQAASPARRTRMRMRTRPPVPAPTAAAAAQQPMATTQRAGQATHTPRGTPPVVGNARQVASSGAVTNHHGAQEVDGRFNTPRSYHTPAHNQLAKLKTYSPPPPRVAAATPQTQPQPHQPALAQHVRVAARSPLPRC